MNRYQKEKKNNKKRTIYLLSLYGRFSHLVSKRPRVHDNGCIFFFLRLLFIQIFTIDLNAWSQVHHSLHGGEIWQKNRLILILKTTILIISLPFHNKFRSIMSLYIYISLFHLVQNSDMYHVVIYHPTVTCNFPLSFLYC